MSFILQRSGKDHFAVARESQRTGLITFIHNRQTADLNILAGKNADLQAQRNGNIRLYSSLTSEAETLRRKIDQFKENDVG